MRRAPTAAKLAAAVAAVTALAAGARLAWPSPHRVAVAVAPAAPPAPTTTVAPPPVATSVPAGPDVPVTTTLATPVGTAPTSATPGGPATGSLDAWHGHRLTLPVVATSAVDGATWLQVRLPQRPNGSVAWVPASAVTLSATPWAVVVDLATHQLTAYDAGRRAMYMPVGTGLPGTPTPTGHYFVALREDSPPAGYGPVLFGLSAHSETIADWEGSGDAIIAIHGPITGAAESAIVHGGAALSNGCIRVDPADLAALEVLPVGTPVEIVAGP